MADMPAAEDAAAESRHWPSLSVGLHAQFTNEAERPVVDYDDAAACRAQLRRQFDRFVDVFGRPPTHLDSHHNAHRDPRLLPLFLELSRRHGLPLREHSPARYFSNFYGQWDGETHLEQVSVENLIRMLEVEAGGGVTELSCHPGYVDPEFRSLYAVEREAELRTLCHPGVRRFLDELGIRLIGFGDLPSLTRGTVATREET
jgi:predicted glycoside hydrolase/deacetylase ChbG (UPF0249 family)